MMNIFNDVISEYTVSNDEIKLIKECRDYVDYIMENTTTYIDENPTKEKSTFKIPSWNEIKHNYQQPTMENIEPIQLKQIEFSNKPNFVIYKPEDK